MLLRRLLLTSVTLVKMLKINDGYLAVTSQLDQNDAGSCVHFLQQQKETSINYFRKQLSTEIWLSSLRLRIASYELNSVKKWKLFANSGETMFLKAEQEREKL